MAEIPHPIASGKIDDFDSVKKVAEEIDVHPSTLKRWLRQKKVAGVQWGRDQRNWIVIKKEHIAKLKAYKTGVQLKS